MPKTHRKPAPVRSPDGAFGDYVAGLRRTPKRLPCKYFYDDAGSRLFEEICGLDEYYPTRTESGILKDNAREIAELAGERAAIVELGSGSSEKVRILLEHFRNPAAYVPIEISKEQLDRSCREIRSEFPDLPTLPLCADYTNGLSLPDLPPETDRRVLFFPGSTFGNFEPIEALGFLLKLPRLGGKGAGLLVGIDLKKNEAVLEAAYDDPRGVTAEFNLNILARANREFGADFDLDAFQHRAFYDPLHGRVVMQLESLHFQKVRIGGEEISFSRGERITTEYSYKYSIGEFQAVARLAGFFPKVVWTDPEEMFSLHYLTVA